MEIWETSQKVIRQTLTQGNIPSGRIAAVGITNQRETTVVWDRRTGRPSTTPSSGRIPEPRGSAMR